MKIKQKRENDIWGVGDWEEDQKINVTGEKADSRVKKKENCGQSTGMINEELSEMFRREGPGAERESLKERGKRRGYAQ